MEPVEVTCSFIPEDFSRANKQFRRKGRFTIAQVFIIIVIAVAIVIPKLVLEGFRGQEMHWENLTLPVVIFVILLFVFPFMQRRQLIRKVNANPVLMGPFTFTLTSDEVRIVAPDVTTTVKWDAFAKCVETADYYFLVDAANQATYRGVPKREFASPDQEAAFVAMVESKLGSVK